MGHLRRRISLGEVHASGRKKTAEEKADSGTGKEEQPEAEGEESQAADAGKLLTNGLSHDPDLQEGGEAGEDRRGKASSGQTDPQTQRLVQKAGQGAEVDSHDRAGKAWSVARPYCDKQDTWSRCQIGRHVGIWQAEKRADRRRERPGSSGSIYNQGIRRRRRGADRREQFLAQQELEEPESDKEGIPEMEDMEQGEDQDPEGILSRSGLSR